jgi:hypothetical protein
LCASCKLGWGSTPAIRRCCAGPNSERMFCQNKPVWFSGCSSRFPELLRILENDGATGLDASLAEFPTLDRAGMADRAIASKWRRDYSWSG